MTRRIWVPLSIAVALGATAAVVQAHNAICSCFENANETITCEGGFSDGGKATGVPLRVYDQAGKVSQLREQIVERIKASPDLKGDITEIPAEGTLLPDTYRFQIGDSPALNAAEDFGQSLEPPGGNGLMMVMAWDG